jgi:hypothetical protein
MVLYYFASSFFWGWGTLPKTEPYAVSGLGSPNAHDTHRLLIFGEPWMDHAALPFAFWSLLRSLCLYSQTPLTRWPCVCLEFLHLDCLQSTVDAGRFVGTFVMIPACDARAHAAACYLHAHVGQAYIRVTTRRSYACISKHATPTTDSNGPRCPSVNGTQLNGAT